MNRLQATNEIKVIALSKADGETYLFRYTESRKIDLLRQLGRMAANKELSLTWHDVALLAHKVREAT